MNGKGKITREQLSPGFNAEIDGINSQMSEKANYNDIYNNADIAIAIGYSNKKTTGLYATLDGENYSRVCDFKNFPSSKWDNGLIYYNGYFYSCYDYKDITYNGFGSLNSNYFLGGNKIGCCRTKDFINFEYWDIPFPVEFKQTFSPKFIIENDKFYLTVAMGDCTETTTDAWGIVGYKKYCYLLEYSDDYKTLSSATKISLTDSKGIDVTCKIDPFIYKKDSNYYLFIKNEDSDIIQIYTSTSLTGSYTVQKELTSFNRVEAPTVFYINNKYYLFCYNHNTLNNLILTSSDLLNWSTPNIPNFYGDMFIYNSTFLTLTNDLKTIFYEFIKNNGYSIFKDDYNKTIENTKVRGTTTLLSDISSLKIKKDNVYKIVGTSAITITSIDFSDFNVGDKAYFCVASDDSNASLTIKQQSNVYYNGSGDLTLNNLYSNFLIEIVCIDSNNKSCFIKNIQNKIFSTSYYDTVSGLYLNAIRKGKTIQISIADVFRQAVSKNTVITTSFTLDSYLRPNLPSYGTYLLSNGAFNSIKIYPSGKVELSTSQTVTANSTYFESSVTYISN
jgi:hypothetical protein